MIYDEDPLRRRPRESTARRLRHERCVWMARETTKWPSTRWPITKIMSSDGCNGNRVPLEMGRGTISANLDVIWGMSDKAVVERLLRSVDLTRTVGPAPAIPQGMDDPAQHPAIVNVRHAARIRRQKRPNPSPLRIRKPKEIRHFHRLLAGNNESCQPRFGNPLNGSGP